MNPVLFICTGLCCLALGAAAQSIGPSELNATGGSKVIAGNTYEYALGSLTSNAYVAPGLIVTPGTLQPAKDNGTGTQEPGIAPGDLFVYPNPASDVLQLQPRFGKPGQLSYTLYDALGRQLLSREISLPAGNERQEISMIPYAQGQYHLYVRWKQPGRVQSSTFKIQKTR